MGVVDQFLGMVKTGIWIILIVVNITILVLGVIVMLVGALLVGHISKTANTETVEAVMMIIIAIIASLGAVIATIGFCGSCGSCINYSARCSFLLKSYVIIQILLAVFVAIGMGLLLSNKPDHIGRWETEVKFVYGRDTATTERWDIIMETHYCCGVYNYNDWKGSQYANTTGQPVPDTCCVLTAEDSGIYKNITRCKELAQSTSTTADNGFLNTGGCVYIIDSTAVAVGVVCGLLMAALLLSAGLAFYVIKRHKREDETGVM